MNTQRIEAALQALLQPTNEDAFVIFEDRATGKFVQFTGSAEEPLLLDLPLQALDTAERQRAQDLFRTFSLPGATAADLYDKPGGTIVGQQVSYQLECGKDCTHAAETAMRIFEVVYGLPSAFDLIVEEN